METSYVLVKSGMAHEMEMMKYCMANKTQIYARLKSWVFLKYTK